MKHWLDSIVPAHPLATIFATMAMLGIGLAGIACGGDILPDGH